SLCRIAKQEFNFRWSEIPFVDSNECASRRQVDADLVDAAPLKLQLDSHSRERAHAKFTHRVQFARRKNVIVGRVRLENAPHAFYVVTRKAPVALCTQIAEVQLLLYAIAYPCN